MFYWNGCFGLHLVPITILSSTLQSFQTVFKKSLVCIRMDHITFLLSTNSPGSCSTIHTFNSSPLSSTLQRVRVCKIISVWQNYTPVPNFAFHFILVLPVLSVGLKVSLQFPPQTVCQSLSLPSTSPPILSHFNVSTLH